MTTYIASAPSGGHAAVSPPATRVRSSASTTSQAGYPQGHLGCLTEREKDALEKLKGLLEEGGVWRRGPPASHDDQTLLRYLRARRWVAQDAYQQFKHTEDWRAANHIDTLYRTIDIEAFEQSRRLYPQWTGRRDRRGTPVFVFDVKQLDSKTVSEYERQGAKSTFSDAQTDGNTPPGLLRLLALYENLTRFTQPFCTQLPDRDHPEVPITMSVNIVDITGVGLKQFWNLKSHMQAASQLATAHYPETLDRIFIIGAPFFFSTIWGWIRRWFDPMTVSKIHVLTPHEVRPVLERFIHPSHIPRKYGGELDYSFGQTAVADPAWEGVVAWENGFTSFPPGPLLWEEEEDDVENQQHGNDQHRGTRLVCVATGKQNGQPRSQRICSMPKVWPPPTEQTASHNGTTIPGSTSFLPPTDYEHTQTPDEESDLFEGSQTSTAATTTDEPLPNGELFEKLNPRNSDGHVSAVQAPSANAATTT
ncbi:hypothetical protein E4U55_007615 [Claviceps digitariae]|nr:hypothetical protein E4U55_007615 [Claviceps digitariae]